jgi:Xaa-Pro aminopeptidase
MQPDHERRQRTARAITDAGLAAVACALPSNVLLLTGGYWPVVGTAVAVAAADGRVAVVLPADEAGELAAGFADVVRTFEPGSLHDLRSATDAIVGPLAEAIAELGVPAGGRWGYEQAADVQPRSYVAVHAYRMSLRRVLRAAIGRAPLAAADRLLRGLRSSCTPAEIDRVRRACGVAAGAYDVARQRLRPGVTEVSVAAHARAALAEGGDGRDDGFLAVMSGPRSAAAAGAFARSSANPLVAGELALVHCNNQVGGYWTDVTRTFCLGRPTDEQSRMYDAVFAARSAALAAIRPGARAAAVDAAARSVLAGHGFDDGQFKHGLGHGVPFAAIAAGERPRLHPRSPDVLAVGNVFNIEPAIYLDGRQGLRHCDVVAVTDGGAEVLTPWLCEPEELWLTAV